MTRGRKPVKIDMKKASVLRSGGMSVMQIARKLRVSYSAMRSHMIDAGISTQRHRISQETKNEWWAMYQAGATQVEIATGANVTHQCVSLAFRNRPTPRRSNARYNDLVKKFPAGMVLGRQTVCGEPHHDREHKVWKMPCSCECGIVKHINARHLERGVSFGCACTRNKCGNSEGRNKCRSTQ